MTTLKSAGLVHIPKNNILFPVPMPNVDKKRKANPQTGQTAYAAPGLMAIGNPFKDWLRRRGFWTPVGSAPQGRLTHVFLDGGRACVPPSAMRELTEAYADAILAGYAQHVVECPPKGRMRMFVDIDSKHMPSSLGEEGKGAGDRAVVQDVLNVARRRFPDGTGKSAVVCLKKNTQGQLGGGIHIIWTGDGAVVSGSRAAELRDSLVEGMNQARPHSCIKWEDAIDAAVYRSCSLRLIFSQKRDSPDRYVPAFEYARKNDPCTQTQKKDEKEEKNEDELQNVIHDDDDDDNAFEIRDIPPLEVVTDLAEWVRRTSIFPPVAFSLDTASHEHTRVHTQQGGRGADVPDEWHDADDIGGEETGAVRLKYASVDPDLLEKLRLALPEPYRTSCSIVGVRQVDNQKSKTKSYVLQTNSRFCINLGRCHSSNRVYFVANRDGVFQRCFCTCDTTEGRRFGRCQDLNLRVCDSHPLPVTIDENGEDATDGDGAPPSTEYGATFDTQGQARRHVQGQEQATSKKEQTTSARRTKKKEKARAPPPPPSMMREPSALCVAGQWLQKLMSVQQASSSSHPPASASASASASAFGGSIGGNKGGSKGGKRQKKNTADD